MPPDPFLGYQTGGWLNIWPQWVTQTTASTANINVWPNWVVGTTATGPITTNIPTTASTIWVTWVGTTNVISGITPVAPPREPTPEERAHAGRLALVHRNRTRARLLRRKFAERRAEQLLLEHLTESQRDEWTAGKAFHVETADGRRRYRIALGMAGNVRLVECDGDAPVSKHGRPLRPGSRFCMHVYHPDGWVPDADNVLAQKLLLESEGGEVQFLALANVS